MNERDHEPLATAVEQAAAGHTAAAFWEGVRRSAEDVRAEPSWRHAGIVLNEENFMTFGPEQAPASDPDARDPLSDTPPPPPRRGEAAQQQSGEPA